MISGPPGIGRGTIIKKLLENYPNIFEKSISYTTRLPRDDEIHGKEYYFVSKEEFEKVK